MTARPPHRASPLGTQECLSYISGLPDDSNGNSRGIPREHNPGPKQKAEGSGEFNLQVQQWNSFSLQRSEMFIATRIYPKDLAPLGAKPGIGTIDDAGKGDCAPPELKSKEATAKL